MSPTTLLAIAPTLVAQGMPIHVAVLPAFCAFLTLQIYLFLSHRRAVARQRKTLHALWQQGSAPDQGLVPGKANGQWLGWVTARFYDGALGDGHYRREDVLGELDNWLEGHGSYLFLQRMGIMAPLVGLLITVVGFFFLQPPTADGDLKEIIYALTPLVLGVGTGASLAITNQLLLHFAGKGTDALRTVACRWFDDCVWKFVQAEPRVAGKDVAEALQEMGATIRGSVEQYHGATAAIGQTSQFLRDAGTAMVNVAERLSTDTATFSEEMKAWRSTATGTIRSMGDIVPNIERMTSEWAESVGALRSVIQVPFSQAAARHHESAELFARSVEQIRESAAQLNAEFGAFGQVVNTQTTVGQEWSRSLKEDVLPGQRAFHQAGARLADAAEDLAASQRTFRDAADSMQESGKGLTAFVRGGVEPATRRLAELDQVLAKMRETTEAVRQMTQLRQEFAGLARSLSQAAATAEAIRSLPQEIRAALQTVIANHNARSSPRRPFYLRILGIRARSNGRP